MMLECSDCGKTIAALKGWTASPENSALCPWCLGERVFESSGKDGGAEGPPERRVPAPTTERAAVPANPAAGSEAVSPPIPPGGGGLSLVKGATVVIDGKAKHFMGYCPGGGNGACAAQIWMDWPPGPGPYWCREHFSQRAREEARR